MSNLFNASEAWIRERKLYWIAIGFLMLMCIILGFQVKTKPSDLTIHIPPDLSNGATFNATYISKTDVFSFAQDVFTTINDWNSNGEVDYSANLLAYGPYLTPQFASVLQDDYKTQDQDGQLSNRVQHISLVPGYTFNDDEVVDLGDGAWAVHLQLETQQYEDGQVIKDYTADYWIRVVRYPGDPIKNEYLMALDGFSQPPQRISTIQ